jgi:hypothetical protein
MYKSYLINSNHRVLRGKVDDYGRAVFAPDSSTTVLVAKK